MSTYTSSLRLFITLCPMSCTTIIKTEKIGLRSCTDIPIDYNDCLSAILKDCRKTLELLSLTNNFFAERLKTLTNRSIVYMMKCVYQCEESLYLSDNVNLLWIIHDKRVEPVMVYIKPLFSYLFSNVQNFFDLYVKMVKPIYANVQIGLFKFLVHDWAKILSDENLELPESLFLQSIYFKKIREHFSNKLELIDVYYVYL